MLGIKFEKRNIFKIKFLKNRKKYKIFKKNDFLQVDRPNFSISLNLHMSWMNTLLYSSYRIKRPRESLNSNELKKNSQNSIFWWPGNWYFRTSVPAQTPLPRDCSEWAWSEASLYHFTSHFENELSKVFQKIIFRPKKMSTRGRR